MDWEDWMAIAELPSAKERFALGQQRRKQMRRMEHRIWKAKDRRESPLKLLEASTRGRVPALVALKNAVDGGFAVWVLSRRGAGDGV